MRRPIELSIHGKLYFVLVIFVGMNLSIAAITSDFKLTHMSFTDMWLWSDERNVSLNRARCSAALPVGFGFSPWSHCIEMGELRTFHELRPGMWYWFWKFTW